jgi:hypothetical protein
VNINWGTKTKNENNTKKTPKNSFNGILVVEIT